MDGVNQISKWTDAAGVLYDTEAEAVQGEARRVIRVIVTDACERKGVSVDVDMLVERRTALIDALRKVERLVT